MHNIAVERVLSLIRYKLVHLENGKENKGSLEINIIRKNEKRSINLEDRIPHIRL
jgi:hypothetical protein